MKKNTPNAIIGLTILGVGLLVGVIQILYLPLGEDFFRITPAIFLEILFAFFIFGIIIYLSFFGSPIKKNSFSQRINLLLFIGFGLFFIYALTDIIDNYFIHPDWIEVALKEGMQVAGAFFIFLALKIWISSSTKRDAEVLYKQQLLEIATKGTGIAIWDYDIEKDCLQWDETMFNLYGVDKKDFQHKFEDFSRCLLPEYREGVEKEFQMSLAGEKEFDIEFPILKSDGSTAYIAGSCSVIRNNEGKPVRAIGINYDVTKKKEEEGRLRQFLIAVEQSPTAIVVTDTEANITYINPKFSELTGYSFEEAIGKNPRILKSGHQSQEYYKQLWQNISAGKKWQGEFHNKRKDGLLYWESAFIGPIKNEKGQITGFIGIKEDITQKKKYQLELKKERQRLISILNGIHNLVYVVDMETYEVLFINEFGRKHWGDIEGKKCWQTIQSGQSGPCNFCPNSKIIDSQNKPKRFYRWEFQNTETGKWYDCQDVAIYWTDGRLVKIQSAIDITLIKQTEEKLQKSEAQFKSLFMESPISIIIHDKDNGQIVNANPKAFESYGYLSLGQLKERDIWAEPPYSKKEALKLIKRAVEEGPQLFEWLSRKNNGDLFWEQIHLNSLFIDGVERVLATSLDITQRVRAENQLRKNQENQRILLESIDVGVVIINPKNHIIESINPHAAKLFGLPVKEIVGNQCHKFLCPAQRGACPITELGKEVENAERVMLCSDGSQVPVLKSVRRIKLGGKEVLLETFIDIRDRKQAEEKIKQAQEKLSIMFEQYEALVKNVPGIVFRCLNDPDWTMSFISEEIKRLTGYPASDFINNSVRPYQSIIHPEDREGVSRAIGEAIVAKKAYKVEYRLVSASGDIIWVQERGRAVHDSKDKTLWLDGVIMDITVLKQATVELKKAMDMQSEFTSTVSHELRTPLTAIKEGIAIVLDGSAGQINDEQEDFLSAAKRNVDRLTRLINDVLDFQKLKAGKVEFSYELSDINQIIEEAYRQMLSEAKKQGLSFDLKLDRSVPKVKLDADSIIRVIINLINNAFKFTEKGSVTIISGQNSSENHIYVRVEDTGSGIKNSDLEKLFKDFEQLDKGKERKTGGTGLGLAISKKIVAQHGGKIWAESKIGKGTTFVFILPLKERRGYG